MKIVFKRFFAYFIDILLVSIIATFISSNSYMNKDYKKYEETLTSCNVSKYLEVTSLMANKDYYYKTIDKSTYSEYIMMPYGSTNEKEALEFNVVSNIFILVRSKSFVSKCFLML